MTLDTIADGYYWYRPVYRRRDTGDLVKMPWELVKVSTRLPGSNKGRRIAGGIGRGKGYDEVLTPDHFANGQEFRPIDPPTD